MSILPASGIGDESTGFYNGVAERSLRFNGSNHYLTRQSSTAPNFAAGNQKTWTCSFWIKKTKFGSTVMLLSTIVNNANEFNIYINSTGYFSVGTQTTTLLQSSEALLDPTNWYNLIVRMDTTQSSDTNKLRLYINGNEASYSTDNRSSISENDDLGLLSGINHYYGGRSNGTMFYDGYMAELNVVDGSSLGPTSFGELKNGTWIPVEYSSSYGTQGWRLQFINTTLNSSGAAGSSSTVGADTSGNGNHWQAENITADDSNMLDSPENNFATLNLLQTSNNDSNFSFSEGLLGLSVTNNSGYRNCSATFSPMGIKGYFEFSVVTGTPNFYIGVIEDTTQPTNLDYADTSHNAVNLVSNGGVYQNEVISSQGNKIVRGGSTYKPFNLGTIAAGKVMGMAFDFTGTNRRLWFHNENTYGTSDTGVGNPSTGANPVITESYLDSTHDYRFHFGINTGSGTQTVVFNFGQDGTFAGNETAQGNTDGNGNGNFYYAVPTDFIALCSSSLSDITISPSKATQGDDHFNTVLYTGNGSTTQNISIGLKPDWVWLKSRSNNSGYHTLVDSSRGDIALGSDQSIAEYSVSEFNINTDNTIDVVHYGNNYSMNTSSATFVAWNWVANGGTTSSNSDGDITSTVQANTDAGFSIVTYTGTGTSTDTVGHGLGKKPAWVLVKSRSEAQNWHVYHQGLDSSAPHNYTIFLNATNTRASSSSAYWGGSAPTTTVIGVGSDNSSNKSSTTYVMYCFAEIEGYSKFGSYTGNGSTDGAFVFTGFRPAWVMIKRYSGTGNWFMMDNKRLGYNQKNYRLVADSTLQEYTSTGANIIDIFSNGFKCRTTSTNTNGSNDTYIFMAFAEQPFKFSNAR